MTSRPRHLDHQEPVDELEVLLGFYAARRLAPRVGAIPQIRRAVFEHAEARSPAFANPADSWRGRLGRRLVAAGLAASLALGAAATVVTAGPASPFYDARLWIEAVTLPAAAEQRAEAHEDRLEARLAEAEAAAETGNGAAVARALAAYRAEVEAALADVGDDADHLARLEAALATHLVVLDTLAGEVPAQAADAIQKAANANSQAADKIKEKKDKKDHPVRPEPSNRPARS